MLSGLFRSCTSIYSAERDLFVRKIFFEPRSVAFRRQTGCVTLSLWRVRGIGPFLAGQKIIEKSRSWLSPRENTPTRALTNDARTIP